MDNKELLDAIRAIAWAVCICLPVLTINSCMEVNRLSTISRHTDSMDDKLRSIERKVERLRK